MSKKKLSSFLILAITFVGLTGFALASTVSNGFLIPLPENQGTEDGGFYVEPPEYDGDSSFGLQEYPDMNVVPFEKDSSQSDDVKIVPFVEKNDNIITIPLL